MTILTDDDRLRWSLRSTQGRVARTCAEIARVIASGQWCVSYSGGKDSLVLVALARMVDTAIPILWSDDEAEVPETLLAIDRARLRWGEPWLIVAGPCQHGEWRSWSQRPPLRSPHPAATVIPGLASTWLHGQGYSSLIGTRGAENGIRRRRGRSGPGWHAPLHDWTDADIWAAIAGLDLPVSGLYERLVSAGWPRERCKTVPLVYALDGSYGPYDRLWPDVCAALRSRL